MRKMTLKIQIVKVSGDNAGWRESVLRFIVDLFFYLSISTLMIISLSISSEIWGHEDFMMLINNYKSPAYNFIYRVQQIWFWGELIVILTNKRRRAIHDYIAGTVVITKSTNNYSV